jgi:hypothetical protein
MRGRIACSKNYWHIRQEEAYIARDKTMFYQIENLVLLANRNFHHRFIGWDGNWKRGRLEIGIKGLPILSNTVVLSESYLRRHYSNDITYSLEAIKWTGGYLSIIVVGEFSACDFLENGTAFLSLHQSLHVDSDEILDNKLRRTKYVLFYEAPNGWVCK